MTNRAALYLRQSRDREGTFEGIDRQRERTTQLASLRGWTIVGEYVDNDTSASKVRGPGTAWHRVIEDARSGAVDIIVAVDMDRLLRTLGDLVTLTSAGAKVATVDGELDLTSADGEFRATMAAGLARFEGRRKSERQRRANDQRREAGIPTTGKTPFGYSRDGAEPGKAFHIVEDEAAVIRDAFDGVLAGVTLTGLCREFNEAGRLTRLGKPWQTASLRRILLSPFYVARIPTPRRDGRDYSPRDVEFADTKPGNWEPIVDEPTWRAVRDLLLRPERTTTTGGARKWLLTGLARCGVEGCGAPIRAGGGQAGIHSYRCSAAGHLVRRGAGIDNYVTALTVARLARNDARDLLTAPDRPDADALRAERATVQAGRDGIFDYLLAGRITKAKADALLDDADRRLASIDASMTEAGRVEVFGGVVHPGDEDAVWDAWERLSLDRQRTIVATLWAITIRSVGKGGHNQSPAFLSRSIDLEPLT